MKISFMTFACPQWAAPDVIAAAVRHGYHGIEFRTDADHSHGVEIDASKEQRAEVREQLRDSDIEPCCLATSLQFVNDAAVEDSKARVELAADLGCPGLRVFCGKVPDGEQMQMPAIIEKVAANLRAAAEFAQQHQVELWLETHDTFCKAEPAVAAIRAADHPSVGLNWDNMHPHRMGEPLEKTRELISGLIRHTHFHDAIREPDVVEIKPVGEGGMPMDEMINVLVDETYTGYLSGEWFGEQYGSDPDESLARYHNDMANLAKQAGAAMAK